MAASVVKYLASCGLQRCTMLLSKGYPDISWNPCGGGKYLDFLRFAVFVNASLILCPYSLLHTNCTVHTHHHLDGALWGIICVLDNLCVFVCAGETVEENANVVVRLLIRRPERFGPVLRREGGNGLLAAIEEAIKISEDPARDGPTVRKDRRFPMLGGEEQHAGSRVHLGNAIMSFYAALIDLLGHCAPEMHASVSFMIYLLCFCSASDEDFHHISLPAE
ncbi:ryanodine receptor 1-like [Ictalurus furcatus]|uniref:ryanodine receptor 1-like n=1 Tax=Ictalurus furcatus TaxID=66913 RepID=UPI002350B8F2|nr:ryanodine receptor 1-like [Ictalurus furcatus]